MVSIKRISCTLPPFRAPAHAGVAGRDASGLQIENAEHELVRMPQRAEREPVRVLVRLPEALRGVGGAKARTLGWGICG